VFTLPATTKLWRRRRDAAAVRRVTVATFGLLAFVGCGSGGVSRPRTAAVKGSTSSATGAPLAELVREADRPPPIKVSIPARGATATVNKPLSCGRTNLSPRVAWRGVPPTTRELLVFAVTLHPSSPPTVGWAVAGITPFLSALPAGRLTSGVVPGRNSFGVEDFQLCPAPDAHLGLTSIVVVALPRRLHLHRGFDGASLLARVTQPGAREGSVVISAPGSRKKDG
jgi:phosphatidylethanolamine-binding protein (PEBP) family uncharacterized protein